MISPIIVLAVAFCVAAVLYLVVVGCLALLRYRRRSAGVRLYRLMRRERAAARAEVEAEGERPAKKPMQTSKKICWFAMITVSLVLLGNFVLAWYEKDTLSDVAIAVIGTFGGFVTCGYFALSGARDCSLNKYGVSKGDFDEE